MANAKKNLYLTSEVHLPTGKKAEHHGDPLPLKTVGPGILSELDITDAEIKALPRGIVRSASADEIEAAEQRAALAEVRQIAADADAEREQADAEAEAKKRSVAAEAEREKAAELAKIDAKRAAEREKEQAATTAELNKAQGIETPRGKR